MLHAARLIPRSLQVVLVLLVASLLPACKEGRRAPLNSGTAGSDGTGVPTACSTPSTGCPCSQADMVVECGEVVREMPEYVACAHGVRTCDGEKWSACVTAGTGTQTIGRLRPLANNTLRPLGGTTSCATACDPYCQVVTDDPTDITALPDAGITVSDAGVSLTQTATGNTGVACTALSIGPNPANLTVTQFPPISPNTVQFSATVTPAGCFPGTPPVLWAIDRFDIATIDANGLLTLVSPIAGPIVVTAYAGSLSATTTLDVTVNVLNTTSAPAGTATKFTGATTADTATVLYPYPNTVFPLALLPPLVQWRPNAAGAAAAVKVTLRYPATGTAVFTWSKITAENETVSLNPPTNTITLAGGPRFTIPANVWTAFEQTAKGSQAAVVVQRLIGTNSLRTEIPTTIRFATGQLKGTVYYQSYGTRLVQNFSSTYGSQTIGASQRFGAATLAIRPGATYPTVAAGYTSASDGPGCRVCHSASANGGALVSNLHGAADSALFRLGTDAPNGGLTFLSPNNGKYAWPAIFPDATFIFGNSGPSPDYGSTPPPGGLEGSAWVSGSAPANGLYSLTPGSVGNTVASTGIPSGLRAALPVFSPDGTKIAFNHYAGTVAGKVGDKRSLAVMDFNNGVTPKAFSNFRRLWDESTSACSASFGVTDPCTNLWPSFMPNNNALVYQREVFNNGRVSGSNHADFGGTRSGCDGSGTCGDDGTKADLWWASTDATPTRFRLNQANGLDSTGTLTIPTGATGSVNAHTAVNEPLLNYEPTVNPQAIGGYYWVAFTSRRLYGNVATVNPWWSDPRFKPIGGQYGPTTKKIWVAAISTNPAEGTDPSFPAFYLPGQEMLAGNSKAYWSLEACKAPSNTRSSANLCESNLDCCGAPTTSVCSLQTPIADPPLRHCIPVSSSACIADDSATQCTSHAQCCGFSTGSRCANGTCKKPPPLLLYDTGSLVRDFVAECPRETGPVWRSLQWKATVPTGTSIVFTAASAETAADLATAPTVAAGTASPPGSTSWSTNTVDIDTNLVATGSRSQEYLRVVMALNPSTDRLSAPVISDWKVTYDCLDNE